MVQMHTYETREEWLKARTSYIGGSDAASVLGLNPWMSNTELWEIKTGRRKKSFLDDNEFVKYGHDAEPLLRELFKLDFPDYKVEYEENNLWTNDRYPFGHASLDGWLTDPKGRKGILEIKTSNIMSSMSNEKWKDGIPDNYFCQVLWYLGITEFDFAIVKSQLRYDRDDDVSFSTRHYFIDRKDVESDIEYLFKKGEEFAACIKANRCPSRILPSI